MIGAMPAVAVRHERRRQEKRSKRPSQLYLGGPWLPPSPSTSPSPHLDGLPEYYLCGKVSALHMVVGSLLLGGVVLVVGLVQLSPGAEAAAHKYYLLAAGAMLISLGLVLTALRCFCIYCHGKSAGAGAIPRPDGEAPMRCFCMHCHVRGGGGVPAGGAPACRAVVPHSGVSSIEGLTGAPTPPSEQDALIRPPPAP